MLPDLCAVRVEYGSVLDCDENLPIKSCFIEEKPPMIMIMQKSFRVLPQLALSSKSRAARGTLRTIKNKNKNVQQQV